jgi:glutathione synthase/RimK-type ligase-like ATP-grasp enzyme
VIPSAFFAPGESPRFPSGTEFVVKPAVGAGSRGAKRFGPADIEPARAHAGRLQAAGYDVLVQPYLGSVDSRGETALLYFDGRFSHAIRKGPLLRRDAAEVAGLFAPEAISAREPTAAELQVGAAAVAAVPGGAPLYARVDLIEDPQGQPRVLELELTEPSLFFAYGRGSAERFAAALLARL